MSATANQAYEATRKRLRSPPKIRNHLDAAAVLEKARDFKALAASHYHNYMTRGLGTVTSLKHCGKSDAYNEAAGEWFDALARYLTGDDE